MTDHGQWKEEPPPNRLERWLTRKLQGGGLKRLPRYYPPMRGRDGECPERYAEALLEGLRSAGGDADALERVKDDGRAFRSWAEAALMTTAHPQSGDGLGAFLSRGFAL